MDIRQITNDIHSQMMQQTNGFYKKIMFDALGRQPSIDDAKKFELITKEGVQNLQLICYPHGNVIGGIKTNIDYSNYRVTMIFDPQIKTF